MIDHLDHLVLTTSREAACVDFYTRVLGMQLESFIGGAPRVQVWQPKNQLACARQRV
jgi:catechol 2,3-dioxygenase-like lactoylglutathione lyase family enzyme